MNPTGKCEFCHAVNVPLVGVLAVDPDQRVCQSCLDDVRVPTLEGQYQTVVIPACYRHEGKKSVAVIVRWRCPKCGGPRGEITKGVSLDGSKSLAVNDWHNPCGHEDTYWAMRKEAVANGFNTLCLPAPPGYLGQ